jgi:hypothetical protein
MGELVGTLLVGFFVVWCVAGWMWMMGRDDW